MADYSARLKNAVNILATLINKMNFKWYFRTYFRICKYTSLKGLKAIKKNTTNNCITCCILHKCFTNSVNPNVKQLACLCAKCSGHISLLCCTVHTVLLKLNSPSSCLYSGSNFQSLDSAQKISSFA